MRGADGQKLSSIGTSYIYMKVPASPSWRREKVIVTKTGNNFLLSNADLKNLGILSPNFPEYIGERRREYIKSTQREEELASKEHGYLATDAVTDEDAPEGKEITVSQGEACVTVDCPDDLDNHQRVEAEAYAALYALGGYTYNNIVIEAPEEVCNSVNSDGEK